MMNNKISAKPAISINQAMGIIRTKKKASEKEYKKAIAKVVAEKFKKKN